MPTNKAGLISKVAVEVTKHLTDSGKLVEAGFAAYVHLTGADKTMSTAALAELQMAFMAGADHLFSSIMSIMDPGEEPTDADLRRMDMIHAELERWRGSIAERIQPSQGHA